MTRSESAWQEDGWSASAKEEFRAASLKDDLVAFCEAHYESIVRALSLYCGDPDVAEDLAQDTLVRACRDWRKVQQHPAPEAWLYKAAFNVANSYFRRRAAERRRQKRLEGQRTNTESEPDSAAAIALRAAVVALPRRQRMAVVLRYFADLPVATTASLMECSEGTVKSLSSRAIAALRDAWDEAS